jgi:hypothetical protein
MADRKIVWLEDDHIQREGTIPTLRRAVPDMELDEVSSESEFVRRINEWTKNPPDLFMLDMMVRWTDYKLPEDQRTPEPPRVREEGYSRAGVRCLDFLRQHQELATVPVLFYTILERQDLRGRYRNGLPKNVSLVTKYFPKDHDPKLVTWLRGRFDSDSPVSTPIAT